MNLKSHATKLAKDYSETFQAWKHDFDLYNSISAELAEAKHIVNWAKEEILISTAPKDLGANDEERKAKVNSMLKDKIETVQNGQLQLQTIEHALEMHNYAFKRLNFLLECLKLGGA